jgi:aspartyl-tRNA(Asn)/glutamyl-tRNA(Gln) amidotransferase subunit B
MIMKVKIGLETHVQLNTKSKVFCGCANTANFTEEPEENSYTCETCLGMPGSKPRTNGEVVKLALKVALALNSRIAREMFFSRKTYFYVDMSKNFQITQYEIPIAEGGFVEIDVNGKRKRIGLTRIHIEEDPARIVHVGGLGGKGTLIDYNRSGTPLIEIVTEPDFSTPAEARAFLGKLITILEYLGVYNSASKAVVKSDANISIEGGEKIEVKNITGTREIEQALNYEIVRQRNIVSRGGRVEQATRTWVPEMGLTQEMRTKESEEDYGYILEPDLTNIGISGETKERVRRSLPELPDERYRRFIKQYRIKPEISESIVSELDIAELFEYTAKHVSPRVAGSWIAGYLKKSLNWHKMNFRESGLKREWVIELLGMFESGGITDRNAELAIRKMIEEKRPPRDIVKRHRLGKSGIGIGGAVRKVLEKEKDAVRDFRSGQEKALHFLVGQVMRETKGRADAGEIRKALLKALKK